MAKAPRTTQIPTPPAPVALGNVYCVKIIGSVEEQLTVSTFYYMDDRQAGTASRTDIQELLTLFDAAGKVFEGFQACVPPTFTTHRLEGHVFNMPTLMNVVLPKNEMAGGVPGVHLPTQMCATLIKRTLLRGKRGRGRLSMPAVPLGWVVNSSLITQDQYLFLAARMEMPLIGIQTQFTPGLAAVTFPPPDPPIPRYSFVPLDSVTLNPVLGTCRRRKLGVGK